MLASNLPTNGWRRHSLGDSSKKVTTNEQVNKSATRTRTTALDSNGPRTSQRRHSFGHTPQNVTANEHGKRCTTTTSTMRGSNPPKNIRRTNSLGDSSKRRLTANEHAKKSTSNKNTTTTTTVTSNLSRANQRRHSLGDAPKRVTTNEQFNTSKTTMPVSNSATTKRRYSLGDAPKEMSSNGQVNQSTSSLTTVSTLGSNLPKATQRRHSLGSTPAKTAANEHANSNATTTTTETILGSKFSTAKRRHSLGDAPPKVMANNQGRHPPSKSNSSRRRAVLDDIRLASLQRRSLSMSNLEVPKEPTKQTKSATSLDDIVRDIRASINQPSVSHRRRKSLPSNTTGSTLRNDSSRDLLSGGTASVSDQSGDFPIGLLNWKFAQEPSFRKDLFDRSRIPKSSEIHFYCWINAPVYKVEEALYSHANSLELLVGPMEIVRFRQAQNRGCVCGTCTQNRKRVTNLLQRGIASFKLQQDGAFHGLLNLHQACNDTVSEPGYVGLPFREWQHYAPKLHALECDLGEVRKEVEMAEKEMDDAQEVLNSLILTAKRRTEKAMAAKSKTRGGFKRPGLLRKQPSWGHLPIKRKKDVDKKDVHSRPHVQNSFRDFDIGMATVNRDSKERSYMSLLQEMDEITSRYHSLIGNVFGDFQDGYHLCVRTSQ